MAILTSRLQTGSAAFKFNAQAYQQLVKPIEEARQQANAGGGEKARNLHRQRGKLMARERIHRLLDQEEVIAPGEEYRRVRWLCHAPMVAAGAGGVAPASVD